MQRAPKPLRRVSAAQQLSAYLSSQKRTMALGMAGGLYNPRHIWWCFIHHDQQEAKFVKEGVSARAGGGVTRCAE